jgi:hypothetical protein
MIKNSFVVGICVAIESQVLKNHDSKNDLLLQAIIGVMSVVKGLAELDIQKRMAIKRNGCTAKGEGENVSAPIV